MPTCQKDMLTTADNYAASEALPENEIRNLRPGICGSVSNVEEITGHLSVASVTGKVIECRQEWAVAAELLNKILKAKGLICPALAVTDDFQRAELHYRKGIFRKYSFGQLANRISEFATQTFASR